MEIAITGFICFYDVVPTTGAAIIVVIVIAPSGATPVVVFTNGNVGEDAERAAICGTSAQRIRCAGKRIITS